MSLGEPWLTLPLAWVLGVAWQLQQAALWPWPVYALVALLGVLLWVLALWRPGWRAGPIWLLAGLLCASGVTGWRATLHAAQALPSALEGRDIRVSGRIASLPQTTPLGQRFELWVDSAVLDGQPANLPPRLQLSWFSAARAGDAPAAVPVLQAGERWQLTVRLRQPMATAIHTVGIGNAGCGSRASVRPAMCAAGHATQCRSRSVRLGVFPCWQRGNGWPSASKRGSASRAALGCWPPW